MKSVCFRKLLLCGLALLVAGMGAGAIVRLPRALNPGTEEEIRHTDSELINSRATILLRPARRTAAGSRGERNSRSNPARVAIERDLAVHVPRSLRALQVRIEV